MNPARSRRRRWSAGKTRVAGFQNSSSQARAIDPPRRDNRELRTARNFAPVPQSQRLCLKSIAMTCRESEAHSARDGDFAVGNRFEGLGIGSRIWLPRAAEWADKSFPQEIPPCHRGLVATVAAGCDWLPSLSHLEFVPPVASFLMFFPLTCLRRPRFVGNAAAETLVEKDGS